MKTASCASCSFGWPRLIILLFFYVLVHNYDMTPSIHSRWGGGAGVGYTTKRKRGVIVPVPVLE